MKQDKNRTKTRMAVYLIALENNKLLLGKRQNTGHMDGCWSLLAGHVYEGESCLLAVIREAQEECGLNLAPTTLELIGAMHHRSGEFDYANYIFRVDISGQKISNLEPEKCAEWSFFAPDNLPEPMQDYIKFIIKKTLTHNAPWIAQYGWEYI